jgi:hypothetical protein
MMNIEASATLVFLRDDVDLEEGRGLGARGSARVVSAEA